MSERPSRPPAEALFQAWRDTDTPFDQEEGRARFLGSLAASRAASRGLGRPQQAAWMLAAALVLCALGFGWWRAPAQLTFATSGVPGEAGAWLSTTPAAELPLAFSEGTKVVLAADSRGRVEELDRTGAVFVLERGEVRANVVHRANTDWRFRAGPFDVQVKGTQLDVTWNPERERFTVRVDEGAVLVHGPSIGAEQTVRAGEICVVDVPSRSMRVSAAGDRTSASSPSIGVGAGPSPSDAVDDVDASAASLVGPAAPTGSTLAAPSAPTASTTAASTPSTMSTASSGPSWTKLEERGDYPGAYEAAQREGFASIVRSASADDLLRLAQVSQLAGHGSDGHQALLALRRRFPGSEPAAVAAYELGRASAPSDAARWFGTYLTEAPAGPLAREAAGRRLEALASTGDASARDAAREYLARYPRGPQAPLATRLGSGAR
jgi:hypothetical protein